MWVFLRLIFLYEQLSWLVHVGELDSEDVPRGIPTQKGNVMVSSMRMLFSLCLNDYIFLWKYSAKINWNTSCFHYFINIYLLWNLFLPAPPKLPCQHSGNFFPFAGEVPLIEASNRASSLFFIILLSILSPNSRKKRISSFWAMLLVEYWISLPWDPLGSESQILSLHLNLVGV